MITEATGSAFIVGYILGLCTWIAWAIGDGCYQLMMSKRRGGVVSLAEVKAAREKEDAS